MQGLWAAGSPRAQAESVAALVKAEGTARLRQPGGWGTVDESLAWWCQPRSHTFLRSESGELFWVDFLLLILLGG